MRLRHLRLSNIRSYVSASIPFDEGITLFEGDIGSGKSTILLAIEFALFGLGDTDSTHLLRHGTKRGEVELTLEVGGREVTTLRMLKRTRKKAQVERCVLTVDGSETELSSGEMKARVLELLSFREHPDPKAKSVIFRYGVYTPQEEMRTILSSHRSMRELRKQTLRRAFGVEDYRQARDNLAHVASEAKGRSSAYLEVAPKLDEAMAKLADAKVSTKERAADLKAAQKVAKDALAQERKEQKRLDGLEELEGRHHKALREAEVRRTAVAGAGGDLAVVEEQLERTREAKEQLERTRAKMAEHGEVSSELKGMEKRLRELERLRSRNTKRLERLSSLKTQLEAAEKAAGELEGLQRRLKDIEDPRPRIAEVTEQLRAAEEEVATLRAEVNTLGRDIDVLKGELRELDDLEGEAMCPRCQQPLTAEHLKSLKAKDGKRVRKLEGARREAGAGLNRSEEDVERLRDEFEGLNKQANDREVLQRTIERVEPEAKRVARIRSKIESEEGSELARSLEAAEQAFDRRRYEGLKAADREVHRLQGLAAGYAKDASREPELAREREAALKAVKDGERALRAAEKAVRTLEAKREPGALEAAKERLREARERARRNESELEVAKRDLEVAEAEVDRLEGEVRELERTRALGEAYGHLLRWLRECYGPALDLIERSVLSVLREDMDAATGRWFDMLVEDPDLELAIDEDFSPRMSQQGWEVDIEALSGGERTSVAFAYRLALNGLVRRIAAPTHGNLLLLDEPTEGFSKEQLSRLGTVLREVDVDQAVIVSHERELEGFADRVYRVVRGPEGSQVDALG